MFDAGSIQAHLDIESSAFDRKLTAAENQVKRFESGKHEIKLSAVFDNASLGRARQAFAQLDNQLSRDAMQRMRSSPQGSVLGTLNALFSPHPVSGAPSPQQAASQGLLGKVTQQATGGSSAASPAAQQSLLSRVLPGGNGGGGGVLPAILAGKAASSGGSGGNRGIGSSLLGGIGPGILGIGAKASTVLGLGGAALGALPAVAAVGGAAGIAGAGLGFAALGAKTLIGTKNVKGQPATQGPEYAQAQVAGAALKAGLMAGAQGMLAPLSAALKAIPGLMKSIIPDLKSAFAGAGTLIMPLLGGLSDIAKQVLPLLGSAFRAAAPLLRPLLDGIGGLVKGLLPGLITLLHAAMPAITVFAQILGTLGKDLGTMLAEFAPVIKPASAILKALLDVVSALFPIIGKLAAVFASALAPVFVTLAGVLKSLLPFFTILGKLVASLAGAILGDLVSAFSAVAQLLVAVAPSLAAFAKVLSGVFTVLENSGVFAILGDALEALVKPLAAVIDALLKGLTPLLPPIIKFISSLSGILISGLVAAVVAVLPPLTLLATTVLSAIALVLPVILPLLTAFAQIFTTALVVIISGVAKALTAILDALPPAVLKGIVLAVLGIVSAVKLWAIAQAILDSALIANPIGLIVIALAALGVAIYELATHWSAVWGAIKSVASTVGSFLDNLFHNSIVHTILDIWSLGLIPLAEHWTTVWADIKATASAFWSWLSGVFGTDIANFFTKTIPGWWNTCVAAARTFAANVRAGIQAVLTWLTGTFGPAISNFFTRTIPGWWNATYTAIKNTGASIISWFRALPGAILSAVGKASTTLLAWGKGVINGLLAGMTSVITSVWNFIKGIPGKILSFLGIKSPPQWAIDAGKHIMNGLGIGMTQAQGALSKATTAAMSAVSAGVAGAGVQQWRGLVLQALKMLGLPASLVNDVLYQMQTESGGNPSIVNTWDSNAMAGHPSQGLMQVIPGTFAEYHVAGTSNNILDPLANIAAALNYAAHNAGFGSGPGQVGSGHGYALGGPIMEPVIGFGTRSGDRYTFGEAGPEYVTPGGGDKLDRIAGLLSRLIDTTAAVPAATGAHVGGAISGAAGAASFRTRYPRGGA